MAVCIKKDACILRIKGRDKRQKAEIVILYAQQANVPVKSVTSSANPLITRLPETIVLKPL